MIPFPNISPEIFSFTVGDFEFALRWYAVSYILGFVVAIFIMRYFLKRDYLWRFRTAPFEIDQVVHLLLFNSQVEVG